MKLKKISLALLLASVTAAYAGSENVCKLLPGAVRCSQGKVDTITGNGVVTLEGTTVTGATNVNGMLNASDASFASIEVNGSVNLMCCTINSFTDIKGSLSASSSKFQKNLQIYSDNIHFVNTKVSGDLHIKHTSSKKQVVYLDKHSEITGNIIFDDGNGEVIVRGNSKIDGKITGGHGSII